MTAVLQANQVTEKRPTVHESQVIQSTYRLQRPQPRQSRLARTLLSSLPGPSSGPSHALRVRPTCGADGRKTGEDCAPVAGGGIRMSWRATLSLALSALSLQPRDSGPTRAPPPALPPSQMLAAAAATQAPRGWEMLAVLEEWIRPQVWRHAPICHR